MRPPIKSARHSLDYLLKSHSKPTAKFLAMESNVSLKTMQRILNGRASEVLKFTEKNATFYAARKSINGVTGPIPLFQINEQGRGESLGFLEAILPQGYVLNLKTGGPLNALHFNGGYSEKIPFILESMQPSGFLANKLKNQMLSVSSPIEFICAHGMDMPGSIIVGETSYLEWLRLRHIEPMLEQANLAEEYSKRIESLAESYAIFNGDHPKFLAKRMLDGSLTAHVIVKYAITKNETFRNDSDLLVAEHLATVALRKNTSVSTPSSRLIYAFEKTFLEIERFDRVGEYGRKESLSMQNIARLIGYSEDNTVVCAQMLLKKGLVSKDTKASIETLYWFNQLIANTKAGLNDVLMYLDDGMLKCHPAKGVKPSLFKSTAVSSVIFEPRAPLPNEVEAFRRAYPAAVEFWSSIAKELRVSGEFKAACLEALMKLRPMASM